MNYVLAFTLFTSVAFIWGTLKPSTQPVIGDMVPGLPAAEAQLAPGDRILTIDGTSIGTWEQMAKYIHERPEKKLKLVVERMGKDAAKPRRLNLSLTPRKDPQAGIGLIGVMPVVEKVKVGVSDSLRMGYRDVKAWTLQPLTYIGQKIRSLEGPKELSGPLGIAQMVTKATKEGISYVVYLMAIISVGLGLFNLFPIPVLDGGHVLLYTIEGLLRRPLSRKTMQVANAIGLSVILTIFLYASYQDVLRWRLGLWK
jgi:regulator of sigma E protease